MLQYYRAGWKVSAFHEPRAKKWIKRQSTGNSRLFDDRKGEKRKPTYNTAADSASLVRGDQEDWKTSSLARLRRVSARPAKDQLWVEGVLSSWEDMGGDEREEKSRGTRRVRWGRGGRSPVGI